ncbi:MAG: DUF2784 domain-containing protein, partial [Thermodesulfobacteriota bacterium]|nr:DUF2784 domain-containing protein [Thermodesulfobacteriota bacterium]
LFAVLGALLVLRWQRLAWMHIPLALWAVIVELTGWMCPLTPLEHWLRLKGGIPFQKLGFVEQYLFPLLYPPPLARGFQMVLGASVLGINLLMYAWILRRRVSGKA